MKLPQIQYSQAQRGNTISPGQAAAPHLAKAKVVGQLAQVVTNINEMQNEYDVNNANAAYKQNVTEWHKGIENRKTWSEENPGPIGQTDSSYTREELELMRIDHLVDASEGPVPMWKVYPHAMQQFLDDKREEVGDTIGSAQHRHLWKQDTQNASQGLITRSVQETANLAIEDMVNKANAVIEQAMDDGNWDQARQALETNPLYERSPAFAEVKRRLLNEIDEKEEMEIYDLAYMSGEEDKIESVIGTLTDVDYDGHLNADQRKGIVFSGLTQLDKNSAKEVQDLKLERDYNTTEALTKIALGEWTTANLIASRRDYSTAQYKMLLGQAEVAATGKSFTTNPIMAAQFEVMVLRIENGRFEGTNYEDEVDKLVDWLDRTAVVSDDVTGELTLNISSADVSKWRVRASTLRDEPFDNDSDYAVLLSEVSTRIRGGSEEMVQITPVSSESANLYSEAKRSLRKFVDDNGGTKADVSIWRRENMPYYLSETSRLSFYELPRSVRDSVVQMESGKISVRQTMDSFKEDLNSATSDAEILGIRRDAGRFDQWRNGVGVHYVVD